jgi:siroheme synthase
LKGGDPFVFGRGAEERDALATAGIRSEIVSGVSAAVAVPASVGIPVTHRDYASGFAVITGHECGGGTDLDWSALARIPTLIVLMGLRTLPATAARLIAHGASPETPAAVIASGTLPDAQLAVGTLATIAQDVAAARLESPATLVVGDVVRLAEPGGAGGGERVVRLLAETGA